MTGEESGRRRDEIMKKERKSTCLFSSDACRIATPSCLGSSAYISGSSREREIGRGGGARESSVRGCSLQCAACGAALRSGSDSRLTSTISRSLLSLLIVICMHVSGVLSPSCQRPSGTAWSVACIFCGRHACIKAQKDSQPQDLIAAPLLFLNRTYPCHEISAPFAGRRG